MAPQQQNTTSSMTKQYVIFVENCRKDHIIIINYLQYTGNEEELNKLYKVISDTEEEGFEMYGDISSFSMNIDNLINEDAVDAHMKQQLDYYLRFRKYDGKFVCPFDPEDDNIAKDVFAMDEYFYREGIKCYFR